MSNQDSATGFGMGLITGAVVGLAIGFLYAPRAGKEMRSMIREKSEEAWHRADEIVKEAEARAKKIVEEARGKAAQLKEKE
jgi:gas vesicle protein